MATVDDVRELASGLPRSYEVLVRDRVKFRVGRIVYVAFSADETEMEFAFPKEEREALVGAEPGKFLMPRPSDLRYNWVGVLLGAISPAEARRRMRSMRRRVRENDVAHWAASFLDALKGVPS